jgi:hypothetical protein
MTSVGSRKVCPHPDPLVHIAQAGAGELRVALTPTLSAVARLALTPTLYPLRASGRGSHFEKKFGSAAERSLNEVCSWLKGGS